MPSHDRSGIAVLSVRLPVHPHVRLSHSGGVSKRLNVGAYRKKNYLTAWCIRQGYVSEARSRHVVPSDRVSSVSTFRLT